MGDAQFNLPNISLITNRSTHDAAIAKAQGTAPDYKDGIPTLIYVSSAAMPSCQLSTPRVIALAEANPDVTVYIMELTAEISPMIKFGPQNTPIFIMMRGNWCETVLGPDFRRVELTIRTKFGSENAGS